MPSDTQAAAIGEMITWLEQQLRESRDEQARMLQQLDQLRIMLQDFAASQNQVERALREIDPKLLPFKGLPEKIRSIDENTEHVRQQIVSNKAEIDNAMRLLKAEAEYDRSERSEAFKRIEAAASQLGLIASDVGQVQAQTSQVSTTTAALLERQREIEARVEQFGLRLDRSIEVHRDLEERVKAVVLADVDDRLELVHERLQVVGEMVKRNEHLIEAVTAEQTMREEVLSEISVWREQHNRIDSRINTLEEAADGVLTQIDKLRGDIALLEGRHSGLGERVAGIRRDIAEVVDHVRDEFAKYNQLAERQRRKQIQVLEQELREMKFHSFRPPEEP
jgi:chromosome segregation ATPase